MKDLKKYRFEGHTEDDLGENKWVVRYIDLPNIVGFGATLEEAAREAEENLDFYIDYLSDEGQEIPQPSQPLSVLDASGKLTLRMSPTLHAQVIDRASRENVSINALVIEALSSYIGQKNTAAFCSEVLKEMIFEDFFKDYSNEISFNGYERKRERGQIFSGPKFSFNGGH